MSQRGLEALLRPKSIAVIGASMKPDRAGYLMMRNLLAGGFNGPVMPVTPAYKAVQGCWRGRTCKVTVCSRPRRALYACETKPRIA